MIWENFKMALAAISSAKLRSFLTMLGIIIGVSSVVTITAIGQGVKNEVASQINSIGANSVIIAPGRIISNNGSRVNPGASLGASTLTPKDLTDLAGLKNVTSVAPLSILSGVVASGENQSPSSLIMATTGNWNSIRGQKLIEGRFFSSNESESEVVVLGSAAKTDLFADQSAVGKTVSIRGAQFRVVGTLVSEATGLNFGSSFDSVVYLPSGAAKKLIGSEPPIFRILIQADSASGVQKVVDAAKPLLLANHGGQEDFSVLKQSDIIDATGNILDLLTRLIAAIASIALLVGGIGIMNIMLVSVTERTREIGVRKAIGASSGMILTQFLIESVTISVLGGALGLGLALLEGLATRQFAKITPAYTPQAIALAFGVSAAVGIIFGLAPALRAARKRPIEALRYE